MMTTNKTTVIAITIIALALLGMSFAKMPFAYYQFMKIALTAIFIYFAFALKNFFSVPYSALAILFNPIVPLTIKKSQWEAIDAAVISLLIVLMIAIVIVMELKTRKQMKKAS